MHHPVFQTPLAFGEALGELHVVTCASTPGVTCVMWVMQHGVADGMSLCELSREFCELLASYDERTGKLTRDVTPLLWDAPVEVACASSSLTQLAARVLKFVKNPVSSKPLLITPELTKWTPADLVDKTVTTAGSRWCINFTVEQTAALVRLCREHKTTVTGAVLAAAGAGCRAVQGAAPADGDVVQCIAVDVRKHVVPVIPRHGLGCLISAMMCIEPKPDAGCVPTRCTCV